MAVHVFHDEMPQQQCRPPPSVWSASSKPSEAEAERPKKSGNRVRVLGQHLYWASSSYELKSTVAFAATTISLLQTSMPRNFTRTVDGMKAALTEQRHGNADSVIALSWEAMCDWFDAKAAAMSNVPAPVHMSEVHILLYTQGIDRGRASKTTDKTQI